MPHRLAVRVALRTAPLLALLATIACVRVSAYSEAAYQQAVSLKVESQNLIGSATEPYADHKDQVAKLILDLQKAYEYAKGRPNNEFSISQWETLLDPRGALLGGFLERWKSAGKLSVGIVDDMKIQVGLGFDTISGLESGKVKPKTTS